MVPKLELQAHNDEQKYTITRQHLKENKCYSIQIELKAGADLALGMSVQLNT